MQKMEHERQKHQYVQKQDRYMAEIINDNSDLQSTIGVLNSELRESRRSYGRHYEDEIFAAQANNQRMEQRQRQYNSKWEPIPGTQQYARKGGIGIPG
jgi:hypothetical protein